ncbi:type II secretion system protein GspG [Paraburkholderia xenovorans]|nr:type II secretion system protein GspG [Paraburkholderia xenovorans]
MAACASNPGQLATDPNCINATASNLGVGGAQDRADAARGVAAKQDIDTIMQAIKLYHLDNGSYPTQDQGLQALVKKPTTDPVPSDWKDGGYLERLTNDPWGNPYQYLNPGAHGEIDVYSYGASGTGTETAIGSWQ